MSTFPSFSDIDTSKILIKETVEDNKKSFHEIHYEDGKSSYLSFSGPKAKMESFKTHNGQNKAILELKFDDDDFFELLDKIQRKYLKEVIPYFEKKYKKKCSTRTLRKILVPIYGGDSIKFEIWQDKKSNSLNTNVFEENGENIDRIKHMDIHDFGKIMNNLNNADLYPVITIFYTRIKRKKIYMFLELEQLCIVRNKKIDDDDNSDEDTSSDESNDDEFVRTRRQRQLAKRRKAGKKKKKSKSKKRIISSEDESEEEVEIRKKRKGKRKQKRRAKKKSKRIVEESSEEESEEEVVEKKKKEKKDYDSEGSSKKQKKKIKKYDTSDDDEEWNEELQRLEKDSEEDEDYYSSE